MLFQALPQLGVARGHCRWLRQHHQINSGERFAAVAEQFARDALEPVALYCVSRNLARNRQPQSRAGNAIRAAEHGEVAVGATLRGGEHRAELVLFDEARGARKPAVAYGQRRARPLARRAFKILRPFLVAMRARNPWVRLRFLTLG